MTIIKTEITANDTFVNGVVHAVDEIGAVWNVGGLNFIYDLRVLEWPPVLEGIWTLRTEGSCYSRTSVKASTLEEAKKIYIKHRWYAKKDDIVKLESVRAIMSYDEFDQFGILKERR